MEYHAVVERVKQLAQPVLEQNDVELVDLTYRQEGRKMVLRFLVDKEAGITLDECAVLNDEIGVALDRDEAIASSYILEVSSPGLDRPLRTRRDFERVLGKTIEVFLKEHIEGKLSYVGKLSGVDDAAITLEPGNTRVVTIPLQSMHKGRLKIDIGR
jgi:ribosome maturation factor RimP